MTTRNRAAFANAITGFDAFSPVLAAFGADGLCSPCK